MKEITSEFSQHLSGPVTTLATCWKLKRRDGVVLGFTDLDKDITIDALLYQAASGFTPSAIENSASMSVDNLEVEGMLSASAISDDDILAGIYDFAEIEIFLVNYMDLTQGKMSLRTGWLGEVAMSKHYFVAEVRGLMQRLSSSMGNLFSASCRASLGDNACKVDLAAHSITGSVTTGGNGHMFEDSNVDDVDGLYDAGVVTFITGANAGLSMEIKHYRLNGSGVGVFTMTLPFASTILPGDQYRVHKGCDKSLKICHERFNNVLNFRGEPLVPGIDRMLETAGTRSIW